MERGSERNVVQRLSRSRSRDAGGLEGKAPSSAVAAPQSRRPVAWGLAPVHRGIPMRGTLPVGFPHHLSHLAARLQLNRKKRTITVMVAPAVYVITPHIGDRLQQILTWEQYQAFRKNDYQAFLEACSSDELPKLLWAEAENCVRTNGASVETSCLTVPSTHIHSTPKEEILDFIFHGNDPERIYRADKTEFSHQLPGTLEAYELCGYVHPGEAKICHNLAAHALNPVHQGQSYVQIRGSSCGRLLCPVCYHRAILREAGRIEKQFKRMAPPQKGKEPTAEAMTKWGKPKHFTVSFSHEDAAEMKTEAQIEKKLKKARRMLKKIGFFGGVEIYHPYRQDKTIRKTPEPAKPDMTYDETREYSKAHGWANDGSWYFSPHVHYIGYQKGRYAEKIKENYEKTGYVIKMINVCNSVFGTAFYQLTHAGVREGKHAVKWLGIMSNNQIKKNAALLLEDIPNVVSTCPQCKEPMKRYIFVGKPENSPILNLAAGDYWLHLENLDDWKEVQRLHCEQPIENDSTLDEFETLKYVLADGGEEYTPQQ